MLRREGNEFGAVTGRPRRCGWFDVPLLRYTAMVNGFDTLMITKLDVLDQLGGDSGVRRLPAEGADVCEMPATYRALEAVEPVYENPPRLALLDARHRPLSRSCRSAPQAYLNSWKSAPGSKSAAFPPDRSATKP